MESDTAWRLGESNDTIEFATIGENRRLAQCLAEQARRTVHLFTTDLDPVIYDNAPFVDSVAAMVRQHPRARLLVLVQDTGRAVREGHRLVQLAQRLSSRVEIRKPLPDYADLNENYLVADEVGYLRRLLLGRYQGSAGFNDPATAQGLLRQFEEIWLTAEPDPQLRQLLI